jgi:hypothetical protein
LFTPPMSTPLAKVNRTALWTAVSVIAGRPTTNTSAAGLETTPRFSEPSTDSLAVRVSSNGATLCITDYAASTTVTRTAATETLHGLGARAMETEFVLADNSGRRFQAVRRRPASR